MDPREEARALLTSQERLEELTRESPELARLVAQNPTASPDLLWRLSDRSELRYFIVQNPNTPRALLVSLGYELPEEFFANPALPLLLLEDPEYFAKSAHTSLCAHPNAPEFYLSIAATCPGAGPRSSVASNPSCTARVLASLLSDSDDEVRTIAAKRLLQQGEYAPLSTSKHPDIRLRLCRDPFCPASFLEVLSSDASPEVRRSIAAHPSAPPEALEKLSTRDNATRRLVAEHPHTPAHILEKLSRDASSPVRRAVAQHFAAPPSVRALLKQDPDKEVSRAARKYPESLRAQLSTASVQTQSFSRAGFQRGELLFVEEQSSCCISLCSQGCLCDELWFEYSGSLPTEREDIKRRLLNCWRHERDGGYGFYPDDWYYEPEGPDDSLNPAPKQLSMHRTLRRASGARLRLLR